jgi:ribosome-dependent ATPase
MQTLRVEDLSVNHRKKIGIKNVSFESKEGETVGFIGADGAGKSSTLSAIAGVQRFTGKITYKEFTYKSPKQSEKLKKDIGYMPQGIGLVLYETLSVAEHLDFFTELRGIKKDKDFFEYKKHLLEMAGLEKYLDRRAQNLSGGMMQKLSLICTMLHRPTLLILDEPTTGVDPLSRLELWEILKQNAKEFGVISIISTAYMQEASKMDNILLFDENQVIAQGKNEELLELVKPYVYEKIQEPKDDAISIFDATYSLEKLETPHITPTLEALFFVNALKKHKMLPKLEISGQSKNNNKNEVVMKAEKLTKKFGDFVANKDIDMELKSGEILGLVGANGAGKTTFIKMLLGLLPIDGGKLSLLGHSIQNSKDRIELKSKIGYVSQHFALYDDMSVRENMLFFASMHKISASKITKLIKQYSCELGFEEFLDEMPKNLPLGINQRFSLSVALLHDPLVLFLDEPTSGVDAIARAQFWELLRQLKTKRNISVLITTHYMSEAGFCDRVVLLKDGEKIADDSVENLYKSHPNAKDFEDIFLEYYSS